MTITTRYFLKELIKVFTLFILSFYFLFVLIDYSCHMKFFNEESLGLGAISIYYLFQFSKQAEILVSFALLISTIKVLTTLNSKNEIVALMCSGISIKRLLAPFLCAAIFCTTLLYLNFEFVYPHSAIHLMAFEKSALKVKKEVRAQVHNLRLKDGTLLLYGSYDGKKKAFSDVFWVMSPDLIYRMKELYPLEKVPRGISVDELMRENLSEMKKQSSHQNLLFPEMHFEEKSLADAVFPPHFQAPTALIKALNKNRVATATTTDNATKSKSFSDKMNDKKAKTLTSLYYKLSIPLISILAVIAIAPYCVKFSRQLKLFMIYALGLFGMIALILLIQSTLILSESQVVQPFLAVFSPYLILFSFFGIRYATL